MADGWSRSSKTRMRGSSMKVSCTRLLWRRLGMTDRDRGKPDSSALPTPPDMRVRGRRFGGLSGGVHGQSRNPERGEVSIGQGDAEGGRVLQPPRTMIAARRLSGQVGVHTP